MSENKKLGYGKVGNLGAALYAVSALFFPYIQYRPNRVLTGEAYRLWQIDGMQGIIYCAIMLVISLLLFVLPHKRRFMRALLTLAAVFMTLFSLGQSAASLTSGDSIARASMGAGFWLSLASVFLMLSAARLEYVHDRLFQNALTLFSLSIFFVLLFLGVFDGLSVMREYLNRKETFLSQASAHLILASTSVGAATLLGVPLAFALFSRKRLERAVFFLVNLGQTIPTLSLLGLLMVPLGYLSSKYQIIKSLGISGVGFWPAWIALFIYALFPILHNALAGLQMVDPAVTQAAFSVGMTKNQVFYKVQIPLAIPLMISGVRTALTQAMGNAVLAALIGGGGLGSLIFLGLAQSAPDLILLGTLPLVLLTFLTDALLGRVVVALDKGGSL
ncbi:MAG: ABC transporter permease [Clostridiales bacterium]|nr:ABC transporter permease [Clostridiales bacterium]